MSVPNQEEFLYQAMDWCQEQVSKELENRKVLHYLDLIGREADFLDLDISEDSRKHLLIIYDLLDVIRRELTEMKGGRHIPTYRIAK
tara:strand:+ start:4802 stop:5062 length:261 start_codon:yes stop_codon:yes gene_type:complete